MLIFQVFLFFISIIILSISISGYSSLINLKIKNNFFLDIFKGFLSGTLGILTAYMLVGLFVTIFFGLGYFLIKRYNKKNTKLLKEIQPMQYVGIVLCIIACLPFIQYFFMSFMIEGGRIFADNIADEM